MDSSVVFNVQTVLSLVIFTMITKWFVMPKFRTMTMYGVLTVMMFIFGFRYMGTFFAVPGFSNGLSLEFATQGAWVDLIIGIISLGTAFLVKNKISFGIALSWLIALMSTLDFATNAPKIVPLHVADTIGPLMPLMTILGPLWMVATVVLWYILIKKPVIKA